MPLSFRDYLKKDGWIPLHSFNGNHAIADMLKDIEEHKHRQRGDFPLIPAVQELKDLIEKDPDLFMGFTDMFTEAGRNSLVGHFDDVLTHNYIDDFLGPRLQSDDRFDR